MAEVRSVRHISTEGCRLPHTFGLKSEPKIMHKFSSDNCMHRTLAGLPCGIPGMGLEIEGAMQQAPQSIRHCINTSHATFRIQQTVTEPQRERHHTLQLLTSCLNRSLSPMPGIGEEIEGAVQQAPHWLRHCMLCSGRESRGDNSSPGRQLP
jgi:hypothetical protein